MKTQAQITPVSEGKKSEQWQTDAALWFRGLRDRICAGIEALEDECAEDGIGGYFERTFWDRPEGGGGEISIMRGRVFEKIGVNISTVFGNFSEQFRKEIPGANDNEGAFWASGISLVAHPRSPLVPAIHMNTRFIVTSKAWFGGGIDLTPAVPDEAETKQFHAALKECCDRHDGEYYGKFSKWCDEYFFNKHRNEARGVGGIFYDNLDSGNRDADFDFTKDVGETFLKIYTKLVREKMREPWTEEQREQQLIKRGRYAEFNLVYDRGTRFGLMTGGNPEAVLMSLPPEAKWP
jgi:coproporphyrinogen III oxidase